MGYNFDRFGVFPGTILMIKNVYILKLSGKINLAKYRDDRISLIWIRKTFILNRKIYYNTRLEFIQPIYLKTEKRYKIISILIIVIFDMVRCFDLLKTMKILNQQNSPKKNPKRIPLL